MIYYLILIDIFIFFIVTYVTYKPLLIVIVFYFGICTPSWHYCVSIWANNEKVLSVVRNILYSLAGVAIGYGFRALTVTKEKH